METINKLLKKQAPKTNARRGAFGNTNNTNESTSENGEAQKPNAIFVRWVSNMHGNRVGVPEEWLDSPVGSIFANSVKPGINTGGKLIQEVE